MSDVTYDKSVIDNGLDELSEDEPDKDEDNLILGLQIPNPARTIVDKQVTNQSTTANPGAKTLAKNSKKEKKSSVPEVTQILTGYEAVRKEQERIQDIIVTLFGIGMA
ncbi:unnamed protein product [Rhizophagus irregularis]|nr:unnamed protein product [Rhizophagus irregularis]